MNIQTIREMSQMLHDGTVGMMEDEAGEDAYKIATIVQMAFVAATAAVFGEGVYKYKTADFSEAAIGKMKEFLREMGG